MNKNFLQEHPLVRHLLYMLAVSFGILIVAFLFIKIVARQGKEYELPDYRGLELREVKHDNLRHFKFVVIDSVYDAEKPGGVILQQEPLPGTMVKSHRKVYITITTYNPTDVVLPELSNMTVRSAVSALEASGLRCGRLKFVDSPYRNVVLECTCKGKMVYAGETMGQGDVVDLTVGRGESNKGTRVPFVIGQTAAKARRGILSASLNVGQEHFDGVTNRSKAVCYRLNPDYTGVTCYPLGTYVEAWYCDATEEDIERIISNFEVDSTKIFEADWIEDEEDDFNTEDYDEGFDDGWDW